MSSELLHSGPRDTSYNQRAQTSTPQITAYGLSPRTRFEYLTVEFSEHMPNDSISYKKVIWTMYSGIAIGFEFTSNYVLFPLTFKLAHSKFLKKTPNQPKTKRPPLPLNCAKYKILLFRKLKSTRVILNNINHKYHIRKINFLRKILISIVLPGREKSKAMGTNGEMRAMI